MAYQLEYQFRELKKSMKKKNSSLKFVVAVILLVAAVTGARLGGSALEMVLFGKRNNMSSAATQIVTHLQDGMAFDEAVYAFCQEISNE